MHESQSEPSLPTPSRSRRKKFFFVLGISALALLSLWIIITMFEIFTSGRLAPGKDSMVSDLGNLFAHAYQYRIRPTSMEGGDGAYTGYKISTALAKNENGFYTASVLHADTIQFTAVWLEDSTATISVKIGPDYKPIGNSWIYTGSFGD